MDRVDTHHHIVPAFYREWLEMRGYTAGGMPIPQWSVESALNFMDAHKIATAIFSVSTPGAHLGNAIETRQMARALNIETAQIVAKNPGRFGFFATLCLPDVDGSIDEAQRAFDELNADGIVLMTNTDGVYMGDPSLEPLMGFLNAHSAVVFLHPGALPDLANTIDPEVFLEDPTNFDLQRGVASRAGRQPGGIGALGDMGPISRRGDRQYLADRLDPMDPTMIVDEGDHGLNRRSSSAWAKYADALRRISLACRSSRFSRSSAFSFSATSVGRPGLRPLSRSAFFTHSCSVCAVQPILAAIDVTADQRELCSPS